MIKILKFLSEQKLFNIIAGILFFLLVTLPHEWVGVTIAGMFKGVSRAKYDMTILSIGAVVLLFFSILLFREFRKLERPNVPLAFFICCLMLMIISLNSLIIVNIEIIHFIQYALMAILLFPLFKNFFSTLLAVTLLGAIDEAYQYYFLSPERTNYYDFNDVILNLLGAAMGLIFLRFHKDIITFFKPNRKSTHRKTWFIYIVVVSVCSLLIWQKEIVQKGINLLGLDYDWAHYGSVLIRKPTTSFWTEIPPKILYHVVQPVEGLLIISLLLLTFSFLYTKAE